MALCRVGGVNHALRRPAVVVHSVPKQSVLASVCSPEKRTGKAVFKEAGRCTVAERARQRPNVVVATTTTSFAAQDRVARETST